MYLKVHFYDRLLKFIFKEDFKTFEGLASFVEEKTGVPKAYLKITFTDLEGDVIDMTSNDEIEYFLDQYKDEDFKEIMVERNRDSEFNHNKMSQRFNRRTSTDHERPKRHTINVFKENSPNNTMDWSVSTVKKPTDFDDRGDDTDIKSLGFSHNSMRKKSMNDDAVRALEGCFTQMMSQMFEMKIAYESKISTLEHDQKALVKTMAIFEDAVVHLKTENSALKQELLNITKDVSDIKSQDERMTILTKSYTDSIQTSTVFGSEMFCDRQKAIEPTRVERQSCNLNIPKVLSKHDCSMCDMKPITGKRYICLDCKAFHACEPCATTKYHEHQLRFVINSVQMSKAHDESVKNFYRRKSSEPVSLQESLVDIKDYTTNPREKMTCLVQQPLSKSICMPKDEQPDKLGHVAAAKMLGDFKSIKNFIIAHVENDRQEYEKRKRILDITFGEALNDRQKDEIIKKEIALSFEDFSDKLREAERTELQV